MTYIQWWAVVDILFGAIALCCLVDGQCCTEERTVWYKRKDAWGNWSDATRREVEVMPEHEKRFKIGMRVGVTCTALFLLLSLYLIYVS
jgi:hypothetical protein